MSVAAHWDRSPSVPRDARRASLRCAALDRYLAMPCHACASWRELSTELPTDLAIPHPRIIRSTHSPCRAIRGLSSASQCLACPSHYAPNMTRYLYPGSHHLSPRGGDALQISCHARTIPDRSTCKDHAMCDPATTMPMRYPMQHSCQYVFVPMCISCGKPVHNLWISTRGHPPAWDARLRLRLHTLMRGKLPR